MKGLVLAVFECVGLTDRLPRQFALLADRHEPGRELMRDRPAKDEVVPTPAVVGSRLKRTKLPQGKGKKQGYPSV